MKLNPDTLTDLLNPPDLTALDKVLLGLYLQAERPTLPLRDLQALQGAGWLVLTGADACLTDAGVSRAEAIRERFVAWVDRILSSDPKVSLSLPESRPPAIPQGGRSRNAAVRAYVRRCRRVRLSAVLSELKLEGCRAAVKEYIRRDPSLTWEGRGAEAFVCWVEATDNLLRLDRQGAHAPYNPKRVMDTLQAALSPCRGFLAFLPGVAYDGDDQPHPVLNVQYEDPKTETDKEAPWFLVTHENLQAALEGILLGAARVFELRQVKRDLRAWLQDESAAPVGVEAWLYVWQSLVHGQVIHKAVDRRRV